MFENPLSSPLLPEVHPKGGAQVCASEKEGERGGGGEASWGFHGHRKKHETLSCYVTLNDMLDNICVYMRNYRVLAYVGIEKRG